MHLSLSQVTILQTMSSEQNIPKAFSDYFDASPKLFKPLEDEIYLNQPIKEILPQATLEEGEYRLILLAQNHVQASINNLIIGGSFRFKRALQMPGEALVVYKQLLGTVLGKPLEGGLKVGIHTTNELPSQHDENTKVYAVINSDGFVDRPTTRLGYIYPALLTPSDEEFITNNYFPVAKIAEILKPFWK